ncbi:MAG TPA: flagellar motor protein [Bryobacteraceae bacterium]
MAGKRAKPDWATLGGLAVAGACILGGLLLEGGQVADVAQLTAGLIVIGGTIGAVMITTPLPMLWAAMRKLPTIFRAPRASSEEEIEQIIDLAKRARKGGIVSLESDAEALEDPFLRKALSLAVDGNDVRDIRSIMELEIEMSGQRGEEEARVFEAAGGYAPTIGILGAVLGLIQVMKHLEDMDKVGHGIAVAFVATVYGVGSANLFFLPVASKLKLRLDQAQEMKELMLEGVIKIAEGMNPRLIRMHLEAYLRDRRAAEAERKAAGGARARAAVSS